MMGRRLLPRAPAFGWVRLVLALAALAPAGVRAQDPAMARAFELERRGNYAAAVDAYRGVLAAKPGDAAALLGLERALLPIGRSAEIVPQVRAALEANARSAPRLRRGAPGLVGSRGARQHARGRGAVGRRRAG